MLLKRLFIALIFLAIPWSVPCLPDSPDEMRYRVVQLLFEGLERCPPAWPAEILGIASGDVIDLAGLKRRSARLLGSGLFAKVKYKYMLRGSAIDITFFVEENLWDTPVAFDNFIWFEDDVLQEEITKVIPRYEGKIPEQGLEVVRRIARILGDFVKERGIAAGAADELRVVGPSLSEEDPPSDGFPPNPESSGAAWIPRHLTSTGEMIFAVRGRPLPICTVKFVGEPLPRGELDVMTRGILGQEYSRNHVRGYVAMTIEPAFRNLGYAGVDTRRIVAESYAADGCEGVELSLAIEPGDVYRFDGFTWKGDLLLSTAVMESSLKITKGDISDEGLLRRDLEKLLDSYGALGFMNPTYSLERHLDREAGLVSYEIDVEQGPLYYMGSLNLVGATRRVEEWVRSKWELRTGAVFDNTYPERFLKKLFEKSLAKTTYYRFIRSEEGRRFVDVTISYEMKPDI